MHFWKDGLSLSTSECVEHLERCTFMIIVCNHVLTNERRPMNLVWWINHVYKLILCGFCHVGIDEIILSCKVENTSLSISRSRWRMYFTASVWSLKMIWFHMCNYLNIFLKTLLELKWDIWKRNREMNVQKKSVKWCWKKVCEKGWILFDDRKIKRYTWRSYYYLRSSARCHHHFDVTISKAYHFL